MPFEREQRLHTPVLSLVDQVLHATGRGWSDESRSDTPRVVLPHAGTAHFELDGQRRLLDPITPLRITPENAYRLDQCSLRHPLTVVVFHQSLPQVSARLGPGALLALAQVRAQARRGELEPLQGEEQVLAALGGEAPPPPSRAREQRAVLRVREFIAAQPGGEASLAELAALAHVSPFHLARVFRASTGSSLHAYRTRLRMALALERLLQGERELTPLAAELGYSSHSHFSAVFRRHYGVPPSELRRNLTAPGRHPGDDAHFPPLRGLRA